MLGTVKFFRTRKVLISSRLKAARTCSFMCALFDAQPDARGARVVNLKLA
jgi:hypothetical protein